MISEEEHIQYHLEVSLRGCGYPDCDWGKALAIHFKALDDITKNLDLEVEFRKQGRTWVELDDEDNVIERGGEDDR